MPKGLIFDIRRYSVHDGPGIRTTVFFKGCPLRCPWCHNPEGILQEVQEITRTRTMNGRERRYKETAGNWYTPQEVLDAALKDRVFYEESDGGVTFSGGEPLMQPEFLFELLSLCNKEGLHTAIDTSGHAPGHVFARAAQKTGMFLYDIKTTDNLIHKSFTGQGNELVIENLRSLDETGPAVIIRIPVIPGFNSEADMMEDLLDLLTGLKARVQRVDLLPWHGLGQEKYRNLGMSPPQSPGKVIDDEYLAGLMALFSKNGFDVKKGG